MHYWANPVANTPGRTYFEGTLQDQNSIFTAQSLFRSQSPQFVPRPNAYNARSFVVKRVSDSFFQLSQELQKEFPDTQRLRIHVDFNEKERVLVYDYFKHTFLALLRDHPDFPSAEIKKILRYTAEAIKELHDEDWIHIGQS